MLILSYLNLNIISINNIATVNILYSFLLSFLVYNFFNKSYLGDGGSYLLSFITVFNLIIFYIGSHFLYSTFFLIILILICIVIYILMYFFLFKIVNQKFFNKKYE